MNNFEKNNPLSPSSKRTPQNQQQQTRKISVHSPKLEMGHRIEHQFFSRMPDVNSVESDLMKLLNEFSDTRLKKYGTNEIHEKLFKRMDSIRDKQEKIAKNHFERDERLSEAKIEGEDKKAQSMRDLEELTRQKKWNMWQYRENLSYPNENLRNSIEKESWYRSNGSHIKVKQILSETSLCFDIPCYLLNSWIMFFNDAAEITKKLNSVLLGNPNNTAYMNRSLEKNFENLENKLKDFQSIFEYYSASTSSFSKNEAMKLKKSTLKTIENLKFIPVNLHLEQFIVETNQSFVSDDNNLKELTCYDFTSVGAFTTVHTCKSNFSKSMEALIYNDRPFDFEDSNQTDKIKLLESEIFLVFYALKILSTLGVQLIDLKDHTFHKKSEKLIQEIKILKLNLECIYEMIIESFIHYANKYVELTKVELKQIFFNLKEKLNYFKTKLKAFCIELDTLILENNYNQLDDLLCQIIATLVEFYNTIMVDAITDKFKFVNQCAIFSQAMTTLISTIDLKYNKNQNYSDLNIKNLLEFHQKNGILIQLESMLSCFSNEYSMIYEHHQAVQNFHQIFVHLPANYVSLVQSTSDYFNINIEKDGLHVYMYSCADSKPIRVYPILVNVGINEASVTSNILGNNYLQKFINSQSISKLSKYFEYARSDLKINERVLEKILHQLSTKKSLFDDSRPVELLHKVAEITRLMNGFRVTNCKSGKDRTGVGVSLEQCLLLVRNHNLENSMTQQVLDDFRRNGTRMDILKKNVGNAKYAFSKIRYFLLPQLYRPPIELCDDLDT